MTLRSRLARLIRGASDGEPTSIWEGVYPSLSAVPRLGSGYGSADAIAAAEGLLHEIQADEMPTEAVTDHEVLALALRLAGANEPMVVDFGGGVGQSFAALRRLVPAMPFRYVVVDLPETAARGRAIWHGETSITFLDDVSAVTRPVTVVFAKSVLQYFEDYRATLRRLAEVGARFLLLEKFSGVETASYATAQRNVGSASIPYWMINIDEVIELAGQSGYDLRLRRWLARDYDQSNFPPELRMRRASTLLFERHD